MHKAEGVRNVRTPIVVRPEPDIPVIGRLLFMIPADRVASGFRGFLVEEDPREVTPTDRRSEPTTAAVCLLAQNGTLAALGCGGFILGRPN